MAPSLSRPSYAAKLFLERVSPGNLVRLKLAPSDEEVLFGTFDTKRDFFSTLNKMHTIFFDEVTGFYLRPSSQVARIYREPLDVCVKGDYLILNQLKTTNSGKWCPAIAVPQGIVRAFDIRQAEELAEPKYNQLKSDSK